MIPKLAFKLLAFVLSIPSVASAAENLPLRQCLVIPPVGTYGRNAVHTDAIEATIVAGQWTAPKAGDEVKLPDGSARKWEPITAADDGSISHRALGGGYAYFSVPSDDDRVMILEASGHSTVYVNGEPRGGDPYSHGYVHLPVRLRRGSNDFLFHVGRGRLAAKLVEPKATAFINLADTTLPDLLVGQNIDSWAGIIVTNATAEPLANVAIAARFTAGDGSKPQVTPVPTIPPLATRKVAVRLVTPAVKAEGEAELELALTPALSQGEREQEAEKHFDTVKLKLRVLRSEQTHKRTFRSAIDGSVQYYAIVPQRAADVVQDPAALSKTRSLRYLRRDGESLVPESSVESRRENERIIVKSVTTRPGNTLTLTSQFDVDNNLLEATVVVEQGPDRSSAQVRVNDGVARVTRHDGTVNELDCPPGVIVTSAPDWTDAVEMMWRYHRVRGGKQEFAGLWIHPTQEPKRLTFAITRVGEPVRLDRFLVELRGGSRYDGWADERGRMVRLEPEGREGQGIVLEGFEPTRDTAEKPAVAPALVMTLHGAGVEGLGQAACFSAKPNLITIAPTNRRPFGFDWEDWGRLDALEVLDLVEREFGTDPRRTYLTGHSMGGHGAWHIGVTYPSRFAAIGPSAGWISMMSYAGVRRPENPNKMQELLLRSAAASDTLALARNYAQHGVFVLHGDQDDNVPVGQARAMRQRLAEFHPDFVYREQPGAGHWWGNACVDWPPMVEFFLQHTLPERKDIRHIEFTTISPSVSAWSHWIGIDAQQRPFLPSSVNVSFEAKENVRRFNGKTENVARLVLDLAHLEPALPVQVELDGDKLADIPWPTPAAENEPPRMFLERRADHWQLAERPAAAMKSAQRCGPFKEAFRNRMMFVYGTQGTPEENAWSLNKARLDAERFWYQGNGSVDVLTDEQFAASCTRKSSRADEHDRNVILYGNADTNAAWLLLLADSPIQVRRTAIRIGDRELPGDNLSALFVRPRPHSDRALIGIVSGTGLPGLRLTERLPYFVSGTGFPDCLILDTEMLTTGPVGLRAAGFFGLDWKVDSGEFAWRE